MKVYFWALALVFGLAAAAQAEADRVITTTGTGVVDAVPDMATIDVGVTHEAETAGEALQRTSDAMQAILTRLGDAGVEPRDMQTQGLTLQPVWSRSGPGSEAPPRITGFMARNGLLVRVRDLEALGGILDMAVSDGANTFNGLQFSLQEPEPALAQARAAAVRAAVTKAEQFSAAAGVALGPVQSITESGGAPRPVMMEMASTRMAADVPVAPGEVSLSAQVVMVFAIVD